MAAKSILIVDDSPTMARTMSLMLESAGFATRVVHSLEEAQAELVKGRFLAAIVDNNGGHAWVQHLRDTSPKLPIVPIHDAAERKANIEGGLRKPFLSEELLKALAQVVPGSATRGSKPGVGGWFKRLLGLD